ncbi:hypothetical protein Bca4012_095793 [Brassica carinata]|nr:hypothetical protein HID58_082670 [Brassica napus]CAF2113322.1 unnamed protein product [Brassica napus]
MVGCGNSLMSEDMVKDGYEDIMNVDISSVAIEMMRTKHASVPQLKYMQMDVRDMICFEYEYFDTVIDKGQCFSSSALFLFSVLVEKAYVGMMLIKPGGTYFLITYGDPKVRMHHLTPSAYNWNISLYILPRPGFKKPGNSSSSSAKPCLEAIPLTSEGMLPPDYVLEDPDSHFIYICNKKVGEVAQIHPHTH